MIRDIAGSGKHGGGASVGGGASLLTGLAAILILGCPSGTPRAPRAEGVNENNHPPYSSFTSAPPSTLERYCAWYGATRDDVLYYGQSAFWGAYRENRGDPMADLALPGPQRIGRFDLASETPLEPLDLGPSEALSGVWDVLPHSNGRVYFTSLFGSAGYVELASGRVERFEAAGTGLNELALGPMASILASRYGGDDDRGSVAVLDYDGNLLRELELPAPDGFVLEPKTVAYDPYRWHIWVTTDRLARSGDEVELAPRGAAAAHHPTVVLDQDGRVLQQIDDVEVQFATFRRDGTGFLAIVDGSRLELAIIEPGQPSANLASATRLLLDDRFQPTYDFVQDLQFAPDGRLVVTRWGGGIHVLETDGGIATAKLPSVDPDGLYYTAVVREERVCATFCADVTVVCGPAPAID